MQITKIESQIKYKDRSSLYVDGKFAFGLSNFDLCRLHLKEGQELSSEELDMIRQDVLLEDARQYALKLLDRQAYTEKALRRKLIQRGSDAETINGVIAFLKDYRYIDDKEYALRYIETALRIGKSGMRKIQYDLQAKGIPRDVIEEITAEFSQEKLITDEKKALYFLLEKKLKGDFSFESKMKAKRYLLSRGFSVDAVDDALRQLQDCDDFVEE
ncbi:MAG: regulatory protein RecX [Ruminococcaceae bacterium]|nr:regulatory protein RecX [Oscillospiraceae bacterium]